MLDRLHCCYLVGQSWVSLVLVALLTIQGVPMPLTPFSPRPQPSLRLWDDPNPYRGHLALVCAHLAMSEISDEHCTRPYVFGHYGLLQPWISTCFTILES